MQEDLDLSSSSCQNAKSTEPQKCTSSELLSNPNPITLTLTLTLTLTQTLTRTQTLVVLCDLDDFVEGIPKIID